MVNIQYIINFSTKPYLTISINDDLHYIEFFKSNCNRIYLYKMSVEIFIKYFDKFFCFDQQKSALVK
jgi:hypothetical protein